MRRHSIVVRLNASDKVDVTLKDNSSAVTELFFVDGYKTLGHGIGQMLSQLAERQMYPCETAIDLSILAATITAADTRISRAEDAQDSWSREIDLYLPVSDVVKWSDQIRLLERMLRFLTGDYWRLSFRPRQKGMESLIDRPSDLLGANFDSVCLFSGGLDSFVGVIDLLHQKRNPVLVSHYKDASTKSQEVCIKKLDAQYKNVVHRHVRANVSFDKNDMPKLDSEQTTRGRSFIFFSLACLAASALNGDTLIYVPENGLISLNVPPDPLRLGAWSTRTTHPFYMARWQDLINILGIEAKFINPYRFKTKGEMLKECENRKFLQDTLDVTLSCSSVTKARFNRDKSKRKPGHCGYCTPCLIRRAAINTAFSVDTTTYTIDDLCARPLNAREAEAKDVRAFQMASHRLSKKPELADILIHKTGPLNDYSTNEVSKYAGVYRRGVEEVGKVVDSVVIKQ
jgi:7-cyano-7-deazaguanine synthase in queuosine biosynthesis